MTEAEVALAREAVACKHWEWMPGMRMIDAANGFNPCRVVTPSEGVRVTTTSHRLYRPAADAQDVPAWPDWVPDFSDPATVGCLLALVREAWPAECPAHVARGDSGKWRVWIGERVGAHSLHHHAIGTGPTEAAALVAALKAAP